MVASDFLEVQIGYNGLRRRLGWQVDRCVFAVVAIFLEMKRKLVTVGLGRVDEYSIGVAKYPEVGRRKSTERWWKAPNDDGQWITM